MVTNLIGNRRGEPGAKTKRGQRQTTGKRTLVLSIGKISITCTLHDTPTADRIWMALPLFAPVETWGDCIHFEIPVETGRDRTARVNGVAGELYFWSEDDRVIFAFGPTPISRPNEMRLPRPCNVWAETEDDLSVFRAVVPGTKVTLERAG